MQPLGLGIIGLHHQHPRWYWPLWKHLPEYKPIAISEADTTFLNEQRDFYGLDTHSDYKKLLARDDIDVVIIFLPHSQMPEAVARAAQAGKHVIVEKPCAATLQGMEDIMKTAEKHPLIKISAPYCWRNHPVSREIKHIVDEGLIGNIRAVEARLNAGGPHRYIHDRCEWVLSAAEGGGPIWNLGVHFFDYMRWMTGQEMQAICGLTTGPSGPPERDIEDNGQAIIKFENGTSGLFDISYSLPPEYPGSRDIYIALRGTKGVITWSPAWEGFTDEFLFVGIDKDTNKTCSRTITVTSEKIPGYGGQMGRDWLRNFAKAINENSEPEITMHDMYRAVRIANTFYESTESGCREQAIELE